MVSQISKFVVFSNIKRLRFCAEPPFGPGVWGIAVKLLSQVYWSLGLLEREVIYPLVTQSVFGLRSRTKCTDDNI